MSTKVAVPSEIFQKLTDDLCKKQERCVYDFEKKIPQAIKEIDKLVSGNKDYVQVRNSDIVMYLDTKCKILIPTKEVPIIRYSDLEIQPDKPNKRQRSSGAFFSYDWKDLTTAEKDWKRCADAVEKYCRKAFPFADYLEFSLPTYTQLKERKDLLRYAEYYLCVNDGRLCAYRPHKPLSYAEFDSALILPVAELQYSNAQELLMNYFVPCGLCPEGLDNEMLNCLHDLTVLYKLGKQTGRDIIVTDANEVKIDMGIWTSLLVGGAAAAAAAVMGDSGNINGAKKENQKQKSFAEEQLHSLKSAELKLLVDVLSKIKDGKHLEETGNMTTEEIRKKLLECEKVRADIEPYEERLLTDPNRGHWDLFEWNLCRGEGETPYTVETNEEFVSKNPKDDINENGVIAIDFGTKSTVVVYQKDIEQSLPMGIGDGNLSKGPSAKRYENPTVMHFVQLNEFLQAYREKEGRPETKWNDLTISHTAVDQFSNSRSEEYYEYLHQIKQWAGNRKKQFRIRSNDGQKYDLPAFLDLKEDDFNPIELYAYYIGLYINNMRNGIFLDYYLSFPVTYETKIREKIIKSFEKGLKKSLPVSILKNKEIMKNFHVNGEISEPAAYAVCALQEYKLEPAKGKDVVYGIFDFGGGTTDFDFGLWKQPSKDRYDYAIKSLGAGGDQYLGGENILEMLAFEVFKENQDIMRTEGYTFTLAPKCTEFAGSDALLSDSQEAEKNMHNLMEAIRPYWEKTEEMSDEYEDNSDMGQLSKYIIKAARSSKDEHIIDTEYYEVISGGYTEDVVRQKLLGIIDKYNLVMKNENLAKTTLNDTISFNITLFNKQGTDKAGVELKFSRKKLNKLIEDVIREGIRNFFANLTSVFSEELGKASKINILLAGNSCKSPVVKRIFQEEINIKVKEIKGKFKNRNNNNINNDMFELLPPLGTKEACEKIGIAQGNETDEKVFEKPTGKTGVAFGLIQCRTGGAIELIANTEKEIPFQFFIGHRRKQKFVPFKDEKLLTKNIGKPDYGIWYRFIDADAAEFDLYYTTLPECCSGELPVDGNAAVKRLHCKIDSADNDAAVYIRAVDPHTLEYVAAKDRNDVDGTKLCEPVKKELR